MPNELLLQILRTVLPADLENFARICRHTYQVAVAASVLKEHRALVKTFSRFSNSSSQQKTWMLLRQITDHPRLAQYVQHLVLLRVADEQLRLLSTIEIKDMAEIAFGPEWLSDRNKIFPERYAAIHTKARAANSFVSISAMMLLPNISHLSMSGQVLEYEFIFELVEAANAPIGASTLFRRLQVVELESESSTFSLVHLFSNLPSLKRMSARNMQHYDYERDLTYRTPQSSVGKLSLTNCRVGCKSLHEFLHGFTCLEEFEYSREEDVLAISSNPEIYEPFLIRTALLPSKATLRSLVILSPGSNLPPFFGSLRDFSALERVHTNWTTLLPTTKSYPFSMQLSSRLPGRLRKLTLEGRPPWSDSIGWDATLNAFLMAVALAKLLDRIPHWEQLIFSSCPPYWRGDLFGYGEGFALAERQNVRVAFMPCRS